MGNELGNESGSVSTQEEHLPRETEKENVIETLNPSFVTDATVVASTSPTTESPNANPPPLPTETVDSNLPDPPEEPEAATADDLMVFSPESEPPASVPQPNPPANDNEGIRSGRWSPEEKLLFLHGLKVFGKGRWKKIRTFLPMRSLVQIKSHAQKVIKRQEAGKDIFKVLEDRKPLLSMLVTQALTSKVDTYSRPCNEARSPGSKAQTAKRKRKKKAPPKPNNLVFHFGEPGDQKLGLRPLCFRAEMGSEDIAFAYAGAESMPVAPRVALKDVSLDDCFASEKREGGGNAGFAALAAAALCELGQQDQQQEEDSAEDGRLVSP